MIEIVPLVLYPIDWTDCPRLEKFQHLPEFGKGWQEYERDDGDWNDALFHINKGLKEVIAKVHARKAKTSHMASP